MPQTVFTRAIIEDVTLEVEPLQLGHAGPTDHVTVDGWRYRISEQADGTVQAVYQFLDHVGVVRARGPRQTLLKLLDSARPDWTGPAVIALVQLWT